MKPGPNSHSNGLPRSSSTAAAKSDGNTHHFCMSLRSGPISALPPRRKKIGKARHGHRGDREMDEGNERDRTGCREIDAELIRLDEEIEKDEIEIEDEKRERFEEKH